jgi:hypothetical protein
MTDRDDCLSDILKSIRDRRDRKYVADRLDELDDRAGQDEGAASYREALGRAAEEMLKEDAVRSAIRRRNVRMDALKFRDLRSFVDAAATQVPNGYRMGIEARLVGVNRPIFDPKSRQGNQLSAGALGLGAQKDWIGGAVLDMQRLAAENPQMQGLDRLFTQPAMARDWAIERFELTRGDAGKSGRTNNPMALEIAKILQKWDKVRIDALNGEGAWIQDYSGYVTKTFHDPDRMRKAANPTGWMYKGFTEADRQKWASDTLQWIDAKRTFGTTEDADKKLAQMYGGLIDGTHMELQTADTGPIIPNVAGKVSAARELHFKDAESWLAYNQAYGRFQNPAEGWLYNMRSSANHYGLMKIFGSRPKENYGEVYAYALNKTLGTPEGKDLKDWKPALDNRFASVSGESDRPVASAWSGIINGVMAVQRMAKLGLTPFAMLQDNVTIARELGRQGMSKMDRYGTMFSGYFEGAPNSEKREAAEFLHTGILGRLRGVAARFDIGDARAGTMARMENIFFKITGITAMTENKRADAERLMAYWMGKQRGKAFAELGPGETRTLQSFGIGDAEWALLHKAEWNRAGDEVYLTPDVATKISDADMQAYITGRGTISERAAARVPPGVAGPAEANAEAIARAKQDLGLKLWAYYSERGQFAVLEPGHKEKAILYQGTQSGSPLNNFLRLFLQFKQFPTTTITKAWGADVYGGARGMDRVTGIVELMVGSTIAGVMANYLNQFVKGQDPNAPWKSHPYNAMISGFLRGGAASVYGDFLLGEWSRHGQQALETAVGPTFSQLNQVFEIWADLTHMKKGAATASLAARMARNNLPFANMIYTKSAIDYLVYNEFMEWLNPGYLDRMQRTMKDKSGTEFWLRPTQVHSQGLPAALGQAIGGR